jgi:hypothetical protein
MQSEQPVHALQLTDEFWLTGYDKASLAARGFAGRHFAAGVAGGLVGELALKKYVTVAGGSLYLRRWERLHDSALNAVVEEIYDDERELRDQWRAEQAEKEKRAAQEKQALLDALQAQRDGWRPRHGAAWQPPGQPAWQPPGQQPWQPPGHEGPSPDGRDEWIPPGHALRLWIEWLADEDRAENIVIGRVSQLVRLDVKKQRRLFRPPKVWTVPHDSAVSGNAAFRLKRALEDRKPLEPSDRFLVGLLMETGLHLHAFAGLNRGGRDHRDKQLDLLDLLDPMLREVLDVVKSIVGSSTMSGRL